MKPIILYIIMLTATVSCQSGGEKAGNKNGDMHEKGTFGYDLAFLQARDSVIVLSNQAGNGQIIVSPGYQGKVFTSTAAGLTGKSFGWVNHPAFDQEIDPHMNAYGGEDRLWLGPEGGPFSLYFKPGMPMTFENWHTPPAIDIEKWDLVSADSQQVSMSKSMQLLNYAGTPLAIRIDREVRILENENITHDLGVELGADVQAVGFATMNTLTNSGTFAWDKTTGAPCMWNLDMFAPAPNTVILIPYEEQGDGKVATTDYFGEIESSRIAYHNGVLFFKADGNSRGKLGLSPQRAKPIAGSYDPDNKILTITKYDVHKDAVYLNQEWTTDKDPFVGDAVNAYNDGPLEDGGQMGPFYEIESVSPAAFLQPNEKMVHHHNVYHFIGDETQLEEIARKVLGVSFADISNAFN